MQEYQSPIELFERVGGYLAEPLRTTKKAAAEYLLEWDKVRFELATVRKNTAFTLNTRRMAAKQPKDKYVTDLDREVDIKGATAQIQADHDFILTLEIIIAERLETARLWLTL